MAFVEKYKITFMDVEEREWEISFKEDGWGGGSTDLTPGGNPFTLIYNQTEKYQPIIGSSVDIQIVYESTVDALYTENSQEIQISVTIDAADHWEGFLLPGQYTRRFNQPKHYVVLTATDGLGELKDIKFWDDDDDPVYYQQTEMEVIANILQKTGLQFTIFDLINIYEDGYSSATSDSPLVQTYFYPEMYWDEVTGDSQSCYDVLSDILKKYGASIKQYGNDWFMVRPNSFVRDSIVYRAFTYQGVYSSDNTVLSYLSIGSNLKYMHADGELTKLAGYGSCEISVTDQQRTSVIKNGSFDSFTFDGGDDPFYWSDNGTTHNSDVPGSIKVFSNSSVSVPTTYLFIANKLIKPTAIRITMNFMAFNTGVPNTPTTAAIYLRIRVNSVNYFQTDGTWTTTAPTYGDDLGLWKYDLVAASKLTMTEFEDISIDLPGIYDDNIYGVNPEIEIRLHTYQNNEGGPNNYYLCNSFRVEVDYQTDLVTDKIYTYDNSISLNSINQDTLRLADSWVFDEYGLANDDIFYHTSSAVGSADETQQWYIKGDGPTEATGIKIAELLAKQYVEGFRRSLDVFRGTLRSNLDFVIYRTFRDSNFVDEFGYLKSFYPMGIQFNARRQEWNGEWIEITPTYNDQSLDWASDDYDNSAITNNSIAIFTNPVGGTQSATSDPYTCVAGEVIRIIATVTDDGSSDEPNYDFDGNTGELVFGVNRLEFVATAGAKTFDIDHTNGENATCTVSFLFYSLTGV